MWTILLRNRFHIYDLLIFTLIPASLATLTILKVLLIPDCMAFDTNDDANHTFVNLYVAQKILREGHLPLMNLFNNFGTPILGDAITYPFSIQSLTYWFLPFDAAMMVNRLWISMTTMFLLTMYFRTYMSRFSATVGSALVMFAPAFTWNLTHHHYQASVLFFVLILILQERLLQKGRPADYVLLCIGFVFLWLSVNLNIVLLMLPFFFLNHLFLTRGRVDVRMLIFALALLSGILVSGCDLAFLARSIFRSQRVTQFVGVSSNEFTRFPVAVCFLAFLGAFALLFQRSTRVLALRILTMGILPLLLVLWLTNDLSFYSRIPFLKSTDVTRIWWVSNVFLALGFGMILDLMRRPSPLMGMAAGVMAYGACIGEVVLFIAQYHIQRGDDLFLFRLKIFGVICFLAPLGYLLLKLLKSRREPGPRWWTSFIAISVGLFLAVFQVYHATYNVTKVWDLSQCQSSHHFSPKGWAVFQPREFVSIMKPYSRVVSEMSSYLGQDLKIIRDQFFGGGGRSVFLNKAFGDYLLENDLIAVDWTPFCYHFKRPWREDRLWTLGIQYVIQEGRSPDIEARGWKVFQYYGIFLYENPYATSVVYLLGREGPHFLLEPQKNVFFSGNGIQIKLPQIRYLDELVATFNALPEWKAFVDGRPREIFSREDHLIRVPIGPADRNVELIFAPFPAYYFAGSVLVSLLFMAAGYAILQKRRIAPVNVREGWEISTDRS